MNINKAEFESIQISRFDWDQLQFRLMQLEGQLKEALGALSRVERQQESTHQAVGKLGGRVTSLYDRLGE